MKKTAERLKQMGALLMALLMMLQFTACEPDSREGNRASGRPTVICSIYPVYDFARVIAGEHADVYRLLPAGKDSHGYEPSVGDMAAVSKTDLFIYTDDELETWIGALAGSVDENRLIRCAEGIDLEALHEQWEEIEHENSGEEEEEHGHAHKYDAHIWLDPTLAAVMCENIRDALTRTDPCHAEAFAENCAKLVQDLQDLDRAFQALFKRHPDALLCFGGKFSYSHFIRHYGLQYISVYDSCGEEEEVNLLKLLQIIRRMQERGSGYVFTDELSNGLIAGEIRRETGAEILLFHSGHTVSREDEKMSFPELMRKNYDNIARALGEG